MNEETPPMVDIPIETNAFYEGLSYTYEDIGVLHADGTVEWSQYGRYSTPEARERFILNWERTVKYLHQQVEIEKPKFIKRTITVSFSDYSIL